MTTALEFRNNLRTGHISAVEAVQQSLDQIAAQSELGAFTEVQAELALAEAANADRMIAHVSLSERSQLPPLLGLPTAHKDLVRVRGFTTKHGSAAVPHQAATHDDPIAQAVRDAGAICLGLTQVPEFGIAGYSENLIAPPARNPFDPRLTAGGSSGGTATAIAAGMITAAIGSDAGGSIRIPSAACGLVGLKPGRGALAADSLGKQPDPLGVPSMAVSGPMARTVHDAALWFDAVRGLRDEPSLLALDRAAELSGLKIGVSTDSPFASRMSIHFDAAATRALEAAVVALSGAGHRLEAAEIHYGEAYPDAFTTVWTQSLARIPLAPGAEAELGELAQWFLAGARATTAEQLAASVAAIGQFARSAGEQWGAYDVVLTPALAFRPPETGAFWALGPAGDYQLQCEWAPQTSMVNVVGAPALTVPILSDADGLPRGVQLIGRPGSEAQLLQLGAQLLGE